MMKKLTFKKQLYIGIVLITIANILVFISKKWFFINMAWIIYGFLFIANPVYPENGLSDEKGRKAAKIAGCICIAIGLLAKFNP